MLQDALHGRDLCLIGQEEYLFRHSETSEPVKTSTEG